MKRIALFLSLILFSGLMMANQQIAPRATDVTIFLNGAQVTRSANVKLNQGKQVIEFVGLSANLRENSIQVGTDERITILGVSHEIDYTEQEQQNERIKSLETRIEAKECEIATLKTEQEVLKAEQDFLEANKVISGKNEAVSLQNLQQTLNYYRERLNTTKTRQTEITRILKDKNQELSNLKAELSQVAGDAAKETSKILVALSVPQAGTYPIHINYYVTNVNWSATYDLRATSISKPLTLTYKAEIFQNTGEDWKDVNLTLSSTNPSQNNVKPTLYTYKLNEPSIVYHEYDVAMEEAPVAMVAAAPTMAKSARSVSYNSNGVKTKVNENMTAFAIVIKDKYSVPSGFEITTVNVGVFELPTQYEYHAIPKKDKDAFLIAKATEWTQHHLINGKANIYFEGTYVGQTNINTQSANDTLTVSLGRDKSIVVTREAMKDYNKRKVLSSKTEETKAWEIQVKNQKRQAIDIVVFDQIPVSTSSSIEVTSELDGGSLKANTGEVTWKMHVDPNSQSKKTLTYKVKYPKEWDLTIE